VRYTEEDVEAGSGGGGDVAVAGRGLEGSAIGGDRQDGGVDGLTTGRGLFWGLGEDADLVERGRRLGLVDVDDGAMGGNGLGVFEEEVVIVVVVGESLVDGAPVKGSQNGMWLNEIRWETGGFCD
jgi:hypothetical protein